MQDLIAETSLLELLVVAVSVAYGLFRAVRAVQQKRRDGYGSTQKGAGTVRGASGEGMEGATDVQTLLRLVEEVQEDLATHIEATMQRTSRVELRVESLQNELRSSDLIQVEKLKTTILELEQRITNVAEQSQLGHAKVMRQFRAFLKEEKPEPEPPVVASQDEDAVFLADGRRLNPADLFNGNTVDGGGDGAGEMGAHLVAPIAALGRRNRRRRR